MPKKQKKAWRSKSITIYFHSKVTFFSLNISAHGLHQWKRYVLALQRTMVLSIILYHTTHDLHL